MKDKEQTVLQSPFITQSPEVLGGMTVFAGTRVPARALFDYLAGGHNLDDFLDDFPSVDRKQALSVLALVRDTLLATAS